MNGDQILLYYVFLMCVVGTGCIVCPKLFNGCKKICCENDDDMIETCDITPLSSPASSTSSGEYELTLKPDYSSSEEPEDRYVRVKSRSNIDINVEDY